jgi:hypothetical protein
MHAPEGAATHLIFGFSSVEPQFPRLKNIIKILNVAEIAA